MEKQEEESLEQPGKSWVVLEERSQGSIGLPLLLTVAKMMARSLSFLGVMFLRRTKCFVQHNTKPGLLLG